MSIDINKRDFIKGTVATAAAVAVGGCGGSSSGSGTQSAQTAPSTLRHEENELLFAMSSQTISTVIDSIHSSANQDQEREIIRRSLSAKNKREVTNKSLDAIFTKHARSLEPLFLPDEKYTLDIVGLPDVQLAKLTGEQNICSRSIGSLSPSHNAVATIPTYKATICGIYMHSDTIEPFRGALSDVLGKDGYIRAKKNGKTYKLGAEYYPKRAMAMPILLTPDESSKSLRAVNAPKIYTYLDVAKSLVFLNNDFSRHANKFAPDGTLTYNAEIVKIILENIGNAVGIQALAYSMMDERLGWFSLDPWIGPDGRPVTENGEKVYKYSLRDKVKAAIAPAASNALKLCYNDPRLAGVFYESSTQASSQNIVTHRNYDSEVKLRNVDTKKRGAITNAISTIFGTDTNDQNLKHAPRYIGKDGYTFVLSNNSPKFQYSLELRSVEVEYGEGGKPSNFKFGAQAINSGARHMCFYQRNWKSNGSSLSFGINNGIIPDGFKYLDLTGGPLMIYGGPVYAQPTDLEFEAGPETEMIEVIAAVMGASGENIIEITKIPIGLTTALDIGIPTALLAYGAYDANKSVAEARREGAGVIRAGFKKMMKDTIGATADVTFGAIKDTSINVAVAVTGTICETTTAPKKSTAEMFESLKDPVIDFLYQSAAPITIAIGMAVAASRGIQSVPYVGMALSIIGIATTAAELAQTTTAIGMSEWTMKTRVIPLHTIIVKIRNDKCNYTFPRGDLTYHIALSFSNAEPIVQEGVFDRSKIQIVGETAANGKLDNKEYLIYTFEYAPAFGKVSVSWHLFGARGWVASCAGVQEADNVHAEGETALTIVIESEENRIPLSTTTQVEHQQILDFQQGRYVWSSTKLPPQETVTTLSAGESAGDEISELLDITISNTTGQVGYSWRGFNRTISSISSGAQGQLYQFQNISARNDPNIGFKSAQSGYENPTPIQYDLYGDYKALLECASRSITTQREDVRPLHGYGYIMIEKDKRTFLKRFEIDEFTNTFTIDWNKNYGMFNDIIDNFAIHPQGVALAYSKSSKILYTLTLPETSKLDSNTTIQYSVRGTPVSVVADRADALRSNPRALANPVAMCMGMDTAFYVLDDVTSLLDFKNNYPVRIKAYDKSGNPINVEKWQNMELQIRLLDEDRGIDRITYLDMGIDTKGYFYLLNYKNNGASANDFRLDIYDPNGNYLSRTHGFTAGKFAVDNFRTLYTLNYKKLRAGNKTEPTVSIWIPSLP